MTNFRLYWGSFRGLLLRDRGLPPASVHQILGGNALDLLRHLL